MNPYAVLGVAPDADPQTIKRAYRARVREVHPDHNPSPEAARLFADVQEAYAILNDPKPLDRQPARGARPAKTARAWRPGANVNTSIALGFGAAMRGTEVTIEANLMRICAACTGNGCLACSEGLRGEAVSLRAAIPAGIRDGTTLRLPGRGHTGQGGAPDGDLYITVRVRPSLVWRWRDHDLEMSVMVSAREAIFGADLTVPTLQGLKTIRIAPGTQPGARLRLRGEGPARPGGDAGDLIYRVMVHMPAPEELVHPDQVRDALPDPDLRSTMLANAAADWAG